MKVLPRKTVKDGIYDFNYITYNDGKNQKYSYVAVKKEDKEDFENALESGDLNIEELGIILDQGDDEASEVLKEKMHLLYNINEQNHYKILSKK